MQTIFMDVWHDNKETGAEGWGGDDRGGVDNEIMEKRYNDGEKCSFFTSSDSASEPHLLLAPSRKLSAVKPGRKDIKEEWMVA